MRGWANSAVRFRIEKWFWLVFTPVSILTGLAEQVVFVSALSIYALVLSAASAEQAAEAKERQDEK